MNPPSRDVRDPALEWLAGGGEMARVVRSIDWSQTPLGPIETWPQSLRTTVSLCLASTFPISIAWGPHHVQIYNDGYWPICGAKHPGSMGQDFRQCWASAFPVIGDAYYKALAGQAQYLENQRMFLDRFGYLEETFFTFSFSPIRDESGKVGGLFHPVTETTAQMLSQRRVRLLRDLAHRASASASLDEAFDAVAQVLRENALDIPFALLYVLEKDGARLARAVGLSGAPARAAFPGDDPWGLERAATSGDLVVLEDVGKRFGPLACGPYPEAPTEAVVIPLRPAGLERPLALLVAGASARRRLDAAYRDFFDLLGAAVTTALSNARAYEEERRRAEALAEIDRAKTAFFSNVSHEFRTPLTLMLGPLEDALRDGPTREGLETAHRNALRLLKLVNTLLDFARIEAGRTEASFEATDLAAFTAELASVFRSAVERAGLRLRVDCPPLPEPVYVDREMWEKIVLNLLSNAFKFTFEGEIAVSLRWSGDGAELEVRDTGVGIPAEEMPKLFQRFHRVRNDRSRSHEGSGIGLALIQELARLHGGAVEASSEPGRGSAFRVRVPAGRAHLPAGRVGAARTLASTSLGARPFVEEASRWLPDVPTGETVPEGRADLSRRVLVADDNADMRAYVAHLLGRYWSVEAVGDGATALARARENPPDLLVSDVMMPGLDGFQLLRETRNDPRLKDVPVLLLSARAGEESKVEGLAAGADDYLVKPFSAKELVARVRTHLELSALRRAERSSDERFRVIADALPALISYIDAETRYGFANKAYENWFGRRSENILGRTMSEVLGAAAFEKLRPYVERALRGERVSYAAEVPYRTGTRWIDATYVPDPAPDGRIRGFYVLVLDVTGAKAAERALRESEERFRNMADHAPVMVWVSDPEGRGTYLSKSWYAFTGQSPDEGLGSGWLKAVHPDDRAATEKVFLAAYGRREPCRCEYRLRRHDGAWRWALDAATPRFGPNGDFLGYVGSVIDITERKLAEEEIRLRVRERTAELEASLRELDTFAYTVSHDLRAPLRAIHRYSDILLEDAAPKLSAEDVDGLERIRRGAARMDEMIQDLLAYSRVARASVRLGPVDVASVLEEAAASLQVSPRVEGSLPRVLGDRLLLSQCLSNLLSNAFKFTSPGRAPEVTVGAERRGGVVRLRIRDNGIGVDETHRSKLFGLFERLHPSLYPGTGVGLAIVKKAVERMGGQVGFESRTGEGSVFWIELKAADVE